MTPDEKQSAPQVSENPAFMKPSSLTESVDMKGQGESRGNLSRITQ